MNQPLGRILRILFGALLLIGLPVVVIGILLSGIDSGQNSLLAAPLRIGLIFFLPAAIAGAIMYVVWNKFYPHYNASVNTTMTPPVIKKRPWYMTLLIDALWIILFVGFLLSLLFIWLIFRQS